MGALHAGHMSLTEAARRENDQLCVSVFVNPRQFGEHEDFAAYPRTIDEDLEMLRTAGADAVFLPDAGEMYRPDARTSIHVAGLTSVLEGASRPGHFDGVCLIVCKLFNLMQPDRAYFGWKDAQQVRVIQQMVHDLDIPVEVRPMPTIRDDDGLALSSRNRRLSITGRITATRIPEALFAIESRVACGARDAARLQADAIERLASETRLEVDYLQIVDLETLQPLETIDRPALVVIAAVCEDVRLIDSLLIDPG